MRKDYDRGWAMANAAIFQPASLSVVGHPVQWQRAEAVRALNEAVLTAGASLKTDKAYGLELANGSRVLTLPGSDDSVRGRDLGLGLAGSKPSVIRKIPLTEASPKPNGMLPRDFFNQNKHKSY